MTTSRTAPLLSQFAQLVTAFLALLLVSFGTASQAPAATRGPAVCDLRFEVKGTDIQILIGKSKLKGTGEIFCRDNQGNQETLNVKVNVGTPVLFPASPLHHQSLCVVNQKISEFPLAEREGFLAST